MYSNILVVQYFQETCCRKCALQRIRSELVGLLLNAKLLNAKLLNAKLLNAKLLNAKLNGLNQVHPNLPVRSPTHLIPVAAPRAAGLGKCRRQGA